MAKALYICPDTRALAVRDRALVAGTVGANPDCVCQAQGCCAQPGEPCTLPAVDGPAAPLVVSGSSSIRMVGGFASPGAYDVTNTFVGGNAPQYGVACQSVGTDGTHVFYSEVDTIINPGGLREREARIAATRLGAGQNRWDVSFVHRQMILSGLAGSLCNFNLEVLFRIDASIVMTPGFAPCFVTRVASVNYTYQPNTAPNSNVINEGATNLCGNASAVANASVEIESAQFTLVRDGACPTSMRAAGQIIFPLYFLPGSPTGDGSITVQFDLTFTDGSTGCQHDSYPSSCIGACCTLGTCTQTTQAACEAGGGVFVGQGVPCLPSPCGPGTQPPTCCDTACCRVSNLAPGGNLLINWNLTMEVQGHQCCTNFNPDQVRNCLPTVVNGSGVATVPYSGDCMNFTEGQVQGQKTLPNILAVDNNCCTVPTGTTFIFPNVVGFIASCNATSGPLLTFIVRLSTPGGAVVSFVSQSCNSIDFDETVSVFRRSCGTGYFWLADIRFIGSATISSRYPCDQAFNNRPARAQGFGVTIPGLTQDVEYRGPNVTLKSLRGAGGCASCRDSNKGAALI